MTSSRRRLGITAALTALTISAAAGALILANRGSSMMSSTPAIAFETADGRKLSMADFRGRFVLLNIWATWCPPCVKEMPSLDRLQAAKGSDSFEVVALSIDRKGLEVVEPFFKRTGLTKLAIYLDRDAGSMSALKITGLPTTVLIDPTGREIARWAGAREWDHATSVAEIEAHIGKARNTAP